MAVSQEELVMHDCQVVCPQCLAVCQYEGGVLVVRDDSDAPYRHTAVVDTPKRDDSRFCYSCGKQLPAGISFCPYCGADLNAPFDKQEEPAPQIHHTPEPQPIEPKREPEPQRDRPIKEEKPQHQDQPASHVEEKLRTIAHHYTSTQPRLHQNGTMPGPAFKFFAYTAIILLLVLLVYIIYAGLSIETPITG